MILTALLAAIAVIMLLQPTAPRFFAVAVFLGATLFHDLALSGLDGFWYYGSAAALDFAIIVATSGVYPVPRLVVCMHQICMVSMVANLGGWLLWLAYFPPIVYDTVFIGIYTWALWIFVDEDGDNVGAYTMDSWASCFRFSHSPWLHNFTRNKG